MTHRELGCTWPDGPCTCTAAPDAPPEGEATELPPTLLGVPDGAEGVQLPE